MSVLKNKRVDSKVESNDSPEIPDRGETSGIPDLPSGVLWEKSHWDNTAVKKEKKGTFGVVHAVYGGLNWSYRDPGGDDFWGSIFLRKSGFCFFTVSRHGPLHASILFPQNVHFPNPAHLCL